MNKYIIILIAIAFLILTACEENIELDLNSEDHKRLVLYGLITTDTIKHEISLTYTADYFFNNPPVPVINANVTIEEYTDKDLTSFSRSINLQPSGKNDGVFVTSDNEYAIEKRYYKLIANVLEEPIKGIYEAVSFCPPINRSDSMYVGLEYHDDWGEDGYFEVKCYFQDPPTIEWYLFNIFKNGIEMTDTLSKKIVVDDKFYNGNFTNGIGVGYLNQQIEREKVYPGDTILFQACSIPEKYAIFIWEAQEEISFGSPLFDGPPANIKGNISNDAIGFFATFSTSYASVIYSP